MTRVPDTASREITPYLQRSRSAERLQFIEHPVLGQVPIIGRMDGVEAQALLDDITASVSDPSDKDSPAQ